MQTPGTNIHMHEMTYISNLGELKAAVLKLQSRDQQRQYHLGNLLELHIFHPSPSKPATTGGWAVICALTRALQVDSIQEKV